MVRVGYQLEARIAAILHLYYPKIAPFFSRERRKMKVEIGAGTCLSQLLREFGVSSRLGELKG